MSTRGAIARGNDTGFRGVYHHWDSYPSGLGHALYHMYHEWFAHNLDQMLSFLIDQHPAGWSTVVDTDMFAPAGWEGKFGNIEGKARHPVCFCHGDRHEEANPVTQENAAGIGCEYVYVFDAEYRTMAVLSSYYGDNTSAKMIGMFGMGDPDATWMIVDVVRLEEPEPNWDELNKRAYSSA